MTKYELYKEVEETLLRLEKQVDIVIQYEKERDSSEEFIWKR